MIPKAPFGNTVFCDDIREEVGGKLSYMGVYGGNVILHEVPAALTKFAFGIRYYQAIDDVREPVIIRIMAPGEDGKEVTLLEAQLPVAHAQQAVSTPSLEEDNAETPLVALMANVVLTPFQVQAIGRLKVRAYVGPEAEEIRLGSIALEIAPPAATPASDDTP
jgi:hypothetical protein